MPLVVSATGIYRDRRWALNVLPRSAVLQGSADQPCTHSGQLLEQPEMTGHCIEIRPTSLSKSFMASTRWYNVHECGHHPAPILHLTSPQKVLKLHLNIIVQNIKNNQELYDYLLELPVFFSELPKNPTRSKPNLNFYRNSLVPSLLLKPNQGLTELMWFTSILKCILKSLIQTYPK